MTISRFAIAYADELGAKGVQINTQVLSLSKDGVPRLRFSPCTGSPGSSASMDILALLAPAAEAILKNALELGINT